MTDYKTIEIGGHTVTYILDKKCIKNINMRIKPDGILYVSAPKRVSEDYVRKVLLDKEKFILKGLDALAEHKKDSGTICVFGEKCRVLTLLSDEERVVLSDGTFCVFTKDTEDEEHILNLTDSWFYERFCEVYPTIEREVRETFEKVGYSLPIMKISVKKMKSRWGSCSPHNCHISMNQNLLQYPKECIKAVFFHEYTHIFHANHSESFYRFLLRIYPEYYKWNSLLR